MMMFFFRFNQYNETPENAGSSRNYDIYQFTRSIYLCRGEILVFLT